MKKYLYTFVLTLLALAKLQLAEAQLPATGGTGPFGAPSTVTLKFSGPTSNSQNSFTGTVASNSWTATPYVFPNSYSPNTFYVDLGASGDMTAGAATSGGMNYIFYNSGSWGNCQFLGIKTSNINAAGSVPALGITGVATTSAGTVPNWNPTLIPNYNNGAANSTSLTAGVGTTGNISTNTLTFSGTAMIAYEGGSGASGILYEHAVGSPAAGNFTALVNVQVTLKAYTLTGTAIPWIFDNASGEPTYLIRVPATDFYINVLYTLDDYGMANAEASPDLTPFIKNNMAWSTTTAPSVTTSSTYRPASWVLSGRHGTNSIYTFSYTGGTAYFMPNIAMAFNPTFYGPKVPTLPTITPSSFTACGSLASTAIASNVVDANIGIPGNNTVTWQLPSSTGSATPSFAVNPAVSTNVSTGTTGATASSGTISYYVTAGGGCTVGTSATIPYTINPLPAITAMTGSACAPTPFSVTPLNGTNGTVPSGTLYSWTAPALGSGLTVTAGNTGSSASSIGSTITTTNVAPATATYTVTPATSNCTGSTFTLTETINPTPAINAIPATTCSAGSGFTVTPANGTNGFVPTGTTYSWTAPTLTGGMTVTSGSTGSAASNISSVFNNPTSSAQTATYAVTPLAGTCTGATFTVTVTVSPKPAVTNYSTTVCSGGTGFTFTPVDGTNGIVPSGTTYSWAAPALTGGMTVSSGATGSGASSVSSIFNNATTSAQTATYTVTPLSGSCTGSTFTVTVTVNPLPIITPALASVCYSASAQTSSLPYSSPTNTPTNYYINWSTAANTAGLVNVSTTSLPASPIPVPVNAGLAPNAGYTGTIYVTNANNCTSTGATITLAVATPPTINGGAAMTALAVCQNTSATSTTAAFSGTTSSPTNYSITWTSGLTNLASTALPGSSPLTVPIDANANTTNAPVTYNGTLYVSIGSTGCSSTGNTISVVVNPVPVITAMSATTCSGGAGFSVTPVNVTNGVVPASTTYAWTSPVLTGGMTVTSGATGSGASSIASVFSNPTNTSQTATYTVTPTSGAGGSCVGSTFTLTVTVNPTPAITAMTATTCSGGAGFSVTPANGTNGIVPSGTTYSWGAPTLTGGMTVTSGSTGSGASSIASVFNNPTNTSKTATYTVTPLSGSCTGATFTVTVTVNPTPAITAMTATTCHAGSGFSVTPANGTNGIVPSGTTYSWGAPTLTGGMTVTSGATGSGASSIASIFNNPTTTAQTATYSVTPLSGTCTGANFTVTVTVNPTAQITAITAATCSGGAGFSVTPANGTNGVVPSGTTYSWGAPTLTGGMTVTSGATGSGASLIASVFNNPTNTSQTATYSVTPLTGSCTGAAFAVTVTVYPTPAITAMTATTCPGGTGFTAIPVNVTNGIVPASTTYAWTSPTCTGGMTVTSGATGSGASSISSVFNNPTTSAQTATYTVTPTSGAGGGCVGATFTLTVTVNPAPQITAMTATTCHAGSGFSVTPVNGTNGFVPSGTTYSWTAPTLTGGMTVTSGATGSGAASIASVFNNPTNVAQTATYTVTPTSGLTCVGATFMVTVTVNPTAQITAITAATCSGGAGFSVTPANGTNGVVPSGTTYSWGAPALTGGMTVTSGATGSGVSLIASVFNNPTNTTQTSTYSVTPLTGSCTGTAFTMTVTVYATPSITPITATTCSGGSGFTVTPANGTNGIVPLGTTYGWAAPTLTGGMTVTSGATGSGAANISSIFNNPTTSAQTATYTVTPTSGAGGSCVGATFTVTVTVNPTPQISAITASTCNGGTGFTVTPVNGTNGVVPSGTTYSWTTPTLTGGMTVTSGATGSGASSISSIFNNPTTATQTATYSVTPLVGSCTGTAFAITVSVYPTPNLNSTLTPTAVCSGTAFNYTPTSATTGATFSWTRAAVAGISNAAGSGTGAISETLNATTFTGPLTVNYIYTITANGCSNTNTVSVVINPLYTQTTTTIAPAYGANCAATFTAQWNSAPNAIGYYLDVASDAAFTTILSSYNNLSVTGTSQVVTTGIVAGGTYFYRVRVHYPCTTSANSNNTTAVIVTSASIPALPTNVTTVLGVTLINYDGLISTAKRNCWYYTGNQNTAQSYSQNPFPDLTDVGLPGGTIVTTTYGTGPGGVGGTIPSTVSGSNGSTSAGLTYTYVVGATPSTPTCANEYVIDLNNFNNSTPAVGVSMNTLGSTYGGTYTYLNPTQTATAANYNGTGLPAIPGYTPGTSTITFYGYTQTAYYNSSSVATTAYVPIEVVLKASGGYIWKYSATGGGNGKVFLNNISQTIGSSFTVNVECFADAYYVNGAECDNNTQQDGCPYGTCNKLVTPGDPYTVGCGSPASTPSWFPVFRLMEGLHGPLGSTYASTHGKSLAVYSPTFVTDITAPTVTTPTGVLNTNGSITWTTSATDDESGVNANGYNWQYSTSSSSGPWTSFGTGLTNSITITGLPCNATVWVEAQASDCGGTTSAWTSPGTLATATSPTITATPTTNPICTGGNPVINLSSSMTSTTYTWTVAQASGVSGGAACSSGCGSTISYALSNGNSTAATATYSVSGTAPNGCTGTTTSIITVNPNNTASAASSSPTLCINTAISPNITIITTGATGISNDGVSGANSLPTGVSAHYTTNLITISGTPTVSGTFNYSIPLTGGCGTVNATGTIIVTANMTVSVASSSPTLCINTAMSPTITHTTTLATGIANDGVSGANSLPGGVSAHYTTNLITISGTPTVSGTFNYSIALTGGCGTVNATGTIIVTPNMTVSAASSSPTLCINTAISPTITFTTTRATGIANDGVSGANSLPAGVSAHYTTNLITISGTPTVSGTFNYSIALTGGCGTVNATGTITVDPLVSSYGNITASVATAQNLCANVTPAGTFAVTGAAGGSGAFTYQWYSQAGIVSAPSGAIPGSWTLIAGATNSTYAPAGTPASISYACAVSPVLSCAGTNTWASGVLQMTVAAATVSISPAGPTSVCVGTSVVETASSVFSPTWQWQSSPDNLTYTNISGATNITYTIPTASGNVGTTYYHTVGTYSGGTGCSPATSNNVQIIVAAQPNISSTTGASVCTSGSATLGATITGGLSLTYQWNYSSSNVINGTPAGITYTSGTTNPLALAVGSGTTPGSYTYTIIATDAGTGCTSPSPATAILVVAAQPAITNLADVNVCTGLAATATFTTTASGGVSNATGFTWKYGGSPVVNGTPSGFTYSVSTIGQTSTLTVNTTSGVTAGTYAYQCVASFTGSGCASSITSNTGNLIVNPAPTVSTPGSISMCQGGTGNLSTTVTGGYGATYQWETNYGAGYTAVSDNYFSALGITYGGTGSSNALAITSSPTSYTGTLPYKVLVSFTASGCPASILSSAGSATINPQPVVTTQPVATTTICAGVTTGLSIVATSGFSLSYQWQYYNTGTSSWVNVSNGTPTGFTYTSPTTSSLGIVTASTAAAGSYGYRCVVSSTGIGCNPTNSGTGTIIVNATPATITPTVDVNPVCITTTGGGANIQVTSSQTGVNYQLQNIVGPTNVGSAVTGTGSTINLPTGSLSANTTFQVLATATGGCTYTSPTTIPVEAVNPDIAYGAQVGANHFTFGTISTPVIPTGWTNPNNSNAVSWMTGTSTPALSTSYSYFNSVGALTAASTGAYIQTPTGGTSATPTVDLISGSISTVGVSNVSLQWGARKTSGYTGTVSLYYSINGGTTWTPVSFTDVQANVTGTPWALVNNTVQVKLPSAVDNQSSVMFKWSANPSTDASYYSMNDIGLYALGKITNCGGSAINLPYLNTSCSLAHYSIISDPANPWPAATPFVPVSSATLTSSPISINVPAATAAGTYDLKITMDDGAGHNTAAVSFPVTTDPPIVATAKINNCSCNNAQTIFGNVVVVYASGGNGVYNFNSGAVIDSLVTTIDQSGVGYAGTLNHTGVKGVFWSKADGGSHAFRVTDGQCGTNATTTVQSTVPNAIPFGYPTLNPSGLPGSGGGNGIKGSFTNGLIADASRTDVNGPALTCLQTADFGNNWVTYQVNHIGVSGDTTNNKAVVEINNMGQNLDSVSVSVYREPYLPEVNNSATQTTACFGYPEYALERHFLIKSTKSTSNNIFTSPGIGVRLYFSDAEFQDLKYWTMHNATTATGQSAGCAFGDTVTNMNSIYVTKYTGTNEDGSYLNNSPSGLYRLFGKNTVNTGNAPLSAIDVTGATLTTGGATNLHYVQMSVREFSEFWIHGSQGIEALPINMIYFEAVAMNNDSIQLRWATASEVNCQSFDIERSTDATNWTRIGTVSGHGNSVIEEVYAYNDLNVTPQVVYYYRLKQNDFNGNFTYTDVVQAMITASGSFVVSNFVPNPSSGKTQFTVTSATAQEITIDFYDMLGQRVLLIAQQLTAGNNTIDFDLHRFAAGTYSVVVTTDHQIYAKKLVLTK